MSVVLNCRTGVLCRCKCVAVLCTKHERLQPLFYIDHKNWNGDTPFIDLMVKSQIMRRAVSLECPLCFGEFSYVIYLCVFHRHHD